jgi:predicted membrane channel-forming protein YqfA (hemolysin III family)
MEKEIFGLYFKTINLWIGGIAFVAIVSLLILKKYYNPFNLTIMIIIGVFIITILTVLIIISDLSSRRKTDHGGKVLKN